MSRALFWLAAALVGYTYGGFPLLVLLRARLRPRPHREGAVTPTVSVLIAARNEAAVIGAKVVGVLASDYPPDRLEVIIASDGSEDGTADAVRACGDARVRVLDLPAVGKADALNSAAAAARGEVLVFSDANSMLDAGALRALVAPLVDPQVGGVAGDQRYAPPEGADPGAGERSYWDLDRRLKEAESAAGNVISATGALYAIRRSLFAPVPVGVTDDFATSTSVIEQGRRLVFAPAAIAREPVGATASDEFARKVRIMTRGLSAVVLRRGLLDPRRHGFYALQLLSHKVLRRLMVVPLVVLAATAARLWRRSPLYRAAALAQAGLYALGAAGLVAGRWGVARPRALALPAYFCLVNAASACAAANVLRGRRVERWDPRRSPEER